MHLPRSHLRILVLCVVLWLSALGASQHQAYASTTLCPYHCITGFDSTCARAAKILGDETTTNPKQLRIYITTQELQGKTFLFLKSNYKPTGSKYPIKIVTDEPAQLLDGYKLLENVLGMGRDPPAITEEISLTVRRHFRDVEFILDEKLLTDSTWFRLKLHDAANFSIITTDNVQRRAVRVVSKTSSNWAVAERYHIFRMLSDSNAAAAVARLADMPFSRNTTKLISFVQNTATKDALREKLRDVQLVLDTADAKARSRLSEMIRDNEGRTVLFFGHVEGDSFVTRNASGVKEFEVPIQAIEQESRTAGVVPIFLGCDSAGATRTVGIVGKFNTVDAVTRIDRAMRAPNRAEFLGALGDEQAVLLLREVPERAADSKPLIVELRPFETNGAEMRVTEPAPLTLRVSAQVPPVRSDPTQLPAPTSGPSASPTVSSQSESNSSGHASATSTLPVTGSGDSKSLGFLVILGIIASIGIIFSLRRRRA